MTCRNFEPDYAPEGGYTWVADVLTQAILCPTKRPLVHGNPDSVPDGGVEFVTAHRVRVEPVDPPDEFDPIPDDDPSTHLCYGVLTRRSDGVCEILMPSQPSTHSSRTWNAGRVFRQVANDPDGLLPRGACGVIVDYLSPYPVEANYRADAVLCKGVVS